ncbi:hypothetical protein [Mycobacterium sp. 852014-50255_SCH5639931]|uniref:hypothetical protein n=1 Tax=Mycobacterium sp. 852014-50255_SCH5639931 TaxID=1834112 RepID=UPI0007FBB91A|nr:hypothetical protein [Mycobacterium sp. 852014-50255_SCH5639931]OBB63640.1 hypothetical protein A5758_21680 [Mycobacterium sp. 852014-50255_SCH5639931]
MCSSRLGPPRFKRVAATAMAVATGLTATIVLIATAEPPAVRLASAESIAVAEGVTIAPAPGWALGHRGPNWVALSNADGSAQLRVAVKPAGSTDVGAVLQDDMDQYASASGLGNLRNLTAPDTQPLQSANFQQRASVDYTADVPAADGPIPVLGTFTELLNTSNRRSVFIDFRQNNNATPQAVDDGGMMIRSME